MAAKTTYFVVTSENPAMLGYSIVAGPFASRKEAEAHESFSTCAASDIYSTTRYRNARVVPASQITDAMIERYAD